jgi:hypothetical protein
MKRKNNSQVMDLIEDAVKAVSEGARSQTITITYHAPDEDSVEEFELEITFRRVLDQVKN